MMKKIYLGLKNILVKSNAWLSTHKFIVTFALFAIPFYLYFSLGFQHISKFLTADEMLWFPQARIQQYWDAMESRDWSKTRINDKPGITLAYVTAPAVFWGKTQIGEINEGVRAFKNFNLSDSIESMLFDYRAPLLIFNGLMSLYFFWIIRKLTGSWWTGLFGGTLMLLNPVLLGISQIVNPDSLFWVFSAAMLLTFLAFLESGGVGLMLLTMLFFGFTLASKYVGVIFFPFMAGAILIHASYRVSEWNSGGFSVWKKMVWRCIAYALIVSGAIGIFALMMPAVFLNPDLLWNSTINSHGIREFVDIGFILVAVLLADAIILRSRLIIFLTRFGKYPRIVLARVIILAVMALFVVAIVDTVYHPGIVNIPKLSADVGKFSELKKMPLYASMVMEARPLVFSLTPLVLASVLLLWFLTVFKKFKNEWIILILTVFVLVFYEAVIQQKLLVHVRYSIVLYPFMVVLAAILFGELFEWGFMRYFPKILVFALILGLSLPSLLSINPFYFNYTNNILPKDRSIAAGWGYGGYEAAQYLNALPNAENLKVATDYFGTCVFLKTRCTMFTDMISNKADREWKSKSIDYFVISKKGEHRYGIDSKVPYLRDMDSAWKLDIDGRPDNYVKIISSN